MAGVQEAQFSQCQTTQDRVLPAAYLCLHERDGPMDGLGYSQIAGIKQVCIIGPAQRSGSTA
jgi:hypothetical protein